MKKYYFAFLAVPLAFLFDERLVLWQRTIPSDFDRIMGKITHLGKSEWILVPLGLYILYYYVLKRVIAHKTFYVWLSVAVSGIIIQPFKLAIGRARPSKFEAEGAFSFKFFAFEPAYYSMPSGHSTTAMALSMALALLFPKYKIPLLLLGVAIAFTRVIVGAHYFSDVIAGSLIGVITALLLTKLPLFRHSIKSDFRP